MRQTWVKVVLVKLANRGRVERRWQRTVPLSETGEAVLEMCDKRRLPDDVIDLLQAGDRAGGYKVRVYDLGKRDA